MSGLTIADLFCGCGGASQGYESAGFKVAYANDIDELAADAHDLNLREIKVDRRSVTEVRGGEIVERAGRSPDVLHFSAPCQDWSFASTRPGRALGSDRCDLFDEGVRLAGELRPPAVIWENVEGIVKGTARGYSLAKFRELEAHGYRHAYRLLDASWHGVPQARPRAFGVAFRNDLGIEPVFPRMAQRQTAMRDVPALSDIARIVRVAMPGTAKQVQYRSRKAKRADEPMLTLTTMGFSNWGMTGKVETWDGELRDPTERELLALQGFPLDYRFPDHADYKDRWKLLGDSVPPPLARAVGEAVRDALLGLST